MIVGMRTERRPVEKTPGFGRGFIIHRNASRFARGNLRGALNLIQDHHYSNRIYETEESAMERVCIEAVTLFDRFKVQPDLRPVRKGHDLVIYDDAQGVVFTITRGGGTI